MMSDLELTSYALDAAYRPFPTFTEWASKTEVDSVRWNRYTSQLAERGKMAPEVLTRCRQIATRAAALDTGAIEGLYEVDRGFTYTVAIQGAAWELGLAEKGEQVRPLFEAQLQAYDYVLDLATKAERFSEAAIRSLHEQICAAQGTYRVVTAVGPQEQPLPKGQYKSLPNHVRTRKGENHSYAPVDVTPTEMARLMSEMRTEAFVAAHPVLQASYAHYAFVVIHPFADGNGRVARALASAFTYRAISMPIVILSEDKVNYLDALEAADRGDLQSFVNFLLGRTLDTIKLVQEAMHMGANLNASAEIAAFERLYVTRGGFTQEQVEEAGALLMDLFSKELQKLLYSNGSSRIKRAVNLTQPSLQISDSGYRQSQSEKGMLFLWLNSAPPASAQVTRQYFLLLPRDAGGDDDLQLRKSQADDDPFSARVDELLPTPTGILQLRIGIFANRVLTEAVEELKAAAQRALRH